MKKSPFSKRGYAPLLETLEDRTLMAGNVTATLAATTGVLTIQGDVANNAIHLTSYNNAGVAMLRVQGDLVITPPAPPDFTSVNGVSFTDFVYTSITSITMNMHVGLGGSNNAGADKITIGKAGTFATPGALLPGFQIPNVLTINLGTGYGVGATPGPGANVVDILGASSPLMPVVTASTTTANVIDIKGPVGSSSFGANGAENITVANISAGAIRVTTSTGNDNIKGTGLNVGAVIINTGTAGNETINLDSSPGDLTAPPRPGIGDLRITTAGGNDNINVGQGTAATAMTSGNVVIARAMATTTLIWVP